MTTAQEVVPRNQWDEATRVALAQCLVAETGWGSETEKIAVAYVLAKRWRRISQISNRSFKDVIKAYCVVFKRHAKRPWIRDLTWDDARPPYQTGWKATRRLVLDFESGFYKDPCVPAMHWGAPSNHWRIQKGVLRNVVRVCRFVKITKDYKEVTVELRNHFYRLVISG